MHLFLRFAENLFLVCELGPAKRKPAREISGFGIFSRGRKQIKLCTLFSRQPSASAKRCRFDTTPSWPRHFEQNPACRYNKSAFPPEKQQTATKKVSKCVWWGASSKKIMPTILKVSGEEKHYSALFWGGLIKKLAGNISWLLTRGPWPQ